MSEILQAEIVAYSSTKEFFVNALSRDVLPAPPVAVCNLIDMASERLDRPPNKAFGSSELWKN